MKWLNIIRKSEIEDVDISEVVENDFFDIRYRLQMLKVDNPDFDDKFCSCILKMLEVSRANFKDFEVFWVHGDFTPTNMIFNAKSLYVLDLCCNKTGSYYQDIARFWQHLENIKTTNMFRGHIIDELKEAFLSGSNKKVDINYPEFVFHRIKCVITDLSCYKELLKKVPWFRKIHKHYYHSQLKWLKETVEHYR